MSFDDFWNYVTGKDKDGGELVEKITADAAKILSGQDLTTRLRRFVSGKKEGKVDDALLPSPKLEETYLNTSYWVEDVKMPFSFRIGKSSPQLEDLLKRHGAASWAYITAYNPRSIPLTPVENERRNAELLQVVQSMGYRPLSGHGVGDDGMWPPEKSLLILGIDRHTASESGRRYGQNAMVVGGDGKPPELLVISAVG